LQADLGYARANNQVLILVDRRHGLRGVAVRHKQGEYDHDG
jgi:hypothetical protein